MSIDKRTGSRKRPEGTTDEDWLDDPQIDELVSSAKTLRRPRGKSKKRSKAGGRFDDWIKQANILTLLVCVIWGLFAVLAIGGWLIGFEQVLPTLFVLTAVVFLGGIAWMFVNGVNAGGADFLLRSLIPLYRWMVPHPGYDINARNPLMLSANGVFVGAATFGLALLLHPGPKPPAAAGPASGEVSSFQGGADPTKATAVNPPRPNNVIRIAEISCASGCSFWRRRI